MPTFSTLGFEQEGALSELEELESEGESQLLSALLAQLDYLLEGTNTEDPEVFKQEVMSKFDSSAEELREVLYTIILSYYLAGAKFNSSLIESIIPGYSYQSQVEELQLLASMRADESLLLIQSTTRKRLLLLLAGALTITAFLSQYKSVIASVDRAKLINETESISAFNSAIKRLSSSSGFVVALKWNTTVDERTCAICRPRHGIVYPLNVAPPIPAHFRCRCYYAIVIDRRRVISVLSGF